MARRGKQQTDRGDEPTGDAKQAVQKTRAEQAPEPSRAEDGGPSKAAPPKPEARPDVSHGDLLLHWVVKGYEGGNLVGDLRGKKNVEPYFDEYKLKVKRCADVMAEIESISGIPPERLEAIRAVAKHPDRIAELDKELADWKTGPKLKELKAEFMSLNIKGFEDAARTIQAKFADPSRLDEIEKDIKDLKHRIKEKFFEQEFAVHLEPSPATASHSQAETIFIVHKDGTLLSVKSKQQKGQVDKKALSHMVQEIRDRMAKGARDCFDIEGSKVVMENGQHVCVAVGFKGEELPIMRKVIDKVVQIMERKNADVFSSWNGDRARIVDMERYPTALFQALDQMEKR